MKKTIFFPLIGLLFSCTFINAQFDNYKVKNLDVNTKYSDFGVTYLGDSTAIYASTKKIDNTLKRKIWKQNQQPYLELYIGDLTSKGEIDNSKNFSQVINTKYHESNVTFTRDKKTVYFSRNNSIDGRKEKKSKLGKDKGWVLIQLYRATVADNGEWTDITAMPFNNDNYQTGHPSLNKEGNKLYFTSDMPNGYGQTDIYVVDVKKDSITTYGEPQNLGGVINTSGKEMFPYISDTNELYFSTDGHLNGYGNLDIYVSNLQENVFEEVENLGRPINSNKDDFTFAYQSGKRTGHFSSNRDGGKGDDDIYSFEDLRKSPEKEPLVCAQVAKGVVRDKNSGALLPKSTVTLYKGGEKVESVVVGNTAKFEFPVDCEANYKIVGEKRTYKGDSEAFITSNEADLELDLTLNLEGDFDLRGAELLIRIDPIYFDLDKSYIRFDASLELGNVIRIMKKYPGLIIEVGSHTDSRAPKSYNQALSVRRAKSTVSYIVDKGGIDPSRISAKGYGESQPVNRCVDNVICAEDEHQFNRRTEFVIKTHKVLEK